MTKECLIGRGTVGEGVGLDAISTTHSLTFAEIQSSGHSVYGLVKIGGYEYYWQVIKVA